MLKRKSARKHLYLPKEEVMKECPRAIGIPVQGRWRRQRPSKGRIASVDADAISKASSHLFKFEKVGEIRSY